MSWITDKSRQKIQEQRTYCNKINELRKMLDLQKQSENHNVSSFTADDWDMISEALAQYEAETLKQAETRENALDNGSEDGNLQSHGEAHILNGCISLLHELFGRFKEYLEFVGFEPDSDEEIFRTDMTYGEIVCRLFLWSTHHSGGTSTAAKCRTLGVNYSESVCFDAGEEDED